MNLSFVNIDVNRTTTTCQMACVTDPSRCALSQSIVQFVDLLDEVTLLAGKLLLLVDFNIHVDVPNSNKSNNYDWFKIVLV